MVGSGERSFKQKELPIITHHLLHHNNTDERKAEAKQARDDIPRGCLAIKVGSGKERIVVPVKYLNHPLFAQLLKEAEEEYGFHQEGAIAIPCQLEEFRYVQAIIDREHSLHHHHHHVHLVGCFRV